MDPLGESSDCSDNEADKSREFGHGTNVKRQQFNSKQRMDMYAFCVLELELHGGKVSVKKQTQAIDKVLTKREPNNHYYNHSNGSNTNNTKNTIRLQVSRPQGTELSNQYQQQQLQQQQQQQQQHFQHLQQIQHLQQLQQQQQQPHVRRVILLKRLPPHIDRQQQQPQSGTIGTVTNNNDVDNVQNVPEEEQVDDEEQYTYEPTTDVIGDHQYSKKMIDYIDEDIAKTTTNQSENNETNNTATDPIDEMTSSHTNVPTNDNIDASVETRVDTDTNTDSNTNADTTNYPNKETNIETALAITTTNAFAAPIASSSSSTITTTSTPATTNAISIANLNANVTLPTATTSVPPKPGTRTKTGRKPVKRSKSPEAGYNYLEPKALWAHQAWAGRKCYSDVQKTQVLTSWMLRNVQQRFAFYYPESAIPSRTTIKHVFQKCISLGTVDNIKNYRKCTKIVDRNSIEQLMLENPNFSLRQLASKLNVSTGTVSRRCKALGLVPDSVTLKHQQLATARRQKQIQALQQDLGISDLLPPKPSTSRPRTKSRQEASTSSGPSTSNSPYRYYQPPPPSANNNNTRK